MRDGQACTIRAAEVVPGDVLVLRPGSYIVAAARLVEVQRLSVDESALTGESLPVGKTTAALPNADVPLVERHNMVYTGTLVTGGQGLAVVVATDQYTEMGRIQAFVGEAEPPDTPLERQLSQMSRQLVLLGSVLCGLVFGIGLLCGYGMLEMFKTSISLAVAAVPEGLPTVATTTGPSLQRLQEDIRRAVIDDVFQEEALRPDASTQIFINPDGPLIIGGPSMHSGLTGRKNAIDTYGEYSRHSGAALSGKDPTRIDRVGAYAARYAAKNVVAAGLAEECEVQLSYSIGQARPVSVQVETFGTGQIPDAAITALLEQHVDFRLAGIMRQFQLRQLPMQVQGGFYQKLAAYGHVGRMDIELPWEGTDTVPILQEHSPTV